jgi:hypothetical protein
MRPNCLDSESYYYPDTLLTINIQYPVVAGVHFPYKINTDETFYSIG